MCFRVYFSFLPTASFNRTGIKCIIATDDKEARGTLNCIQRNILTLKIKDGGDLQKHLRIMLITTCHD